MKIVINRCWGGFSLSRAAIAWLNERGVNAEYPFGNDDQDRAHPLLVECVETLGEGADGSYARLRIVEIPDDVTDWYIHNYDGQEDVRTGNIYR